MTSPDGAGLPEGPEKIGQWDMLVNLLGLGEKLIMLPLAHLLAALTGGDVEDYDTIGEVVAGLVGLIPVVGDIVKAVLGIFGVGGGSGDPPPWGALNPLSWLSNEMSDRWAKLDQTAAAIDSITSSTQVLEGVLGIGQWTRKEPLNTSGDVIYKPNQQVGKSVGCSYDEATGVVTLHSRGLWFVQHRSMYGKVRTAKLQANTVECIIEMSYDNFATTYARIFDKIDPHTSSAGFDEDYYAATVKPSDYIVFPEPGVKIRVRLNVYPTRRSGGGFAFNALTVKKEDTGLGPGARLDDAMPLTSSWQKVAPMLSTGGAASASSELVMPAVASVRLDSESTATAPYEMRIVRGGTPLVTSAAPAAEQSITWSGSAAAGVRVWLEARSSSGAILNANNATWLTYFDHNQYAEVA